MKLIAPLIALFLIGCVLYGVYAGVAAIVRNARRVGLGKSDDTADASVLANGNPTPRPHPPSVVDELQTLFELHQAGALTREEFEQLKTQTLHTGTSKNRLIQPARKVKLTEAAQLVIFWAIRGRFERFSPVFPHLLHTCPPCRRKSVFDGDAL